MLVLPVLRGHWSVGEDACQSFKGCCRALLSWLRSLHQQEAARVIQSLCRCTHWMLRYEHGPFARRSALINMRKAVVNMHCVHVQCQRRSRAPGLHGQSRWTAAWPRNGARCRTCRRCWRWSPCCERRQRTALPWPVEAEALPQRRRCSGSARGGHCFWTLHKAACRVLRGL